MSKKNNNIKTILSYLFGFLFVWIVMYGQAILLHYWTFNVWKLFFNPILVFTELSKWPGELFFFYILFAIPLMFAIGRGIFGWMFGD